MSFLYFFAALFKVQGDWLKPDGGTLYKAPGKLQGAFFGNRTDLCVCVNKKRTNLYLSLYYIYIYRTSMYTCIYMYICITIWFKLDALNVGT